VILIKNNDPTTKGSAATIAALAECDDVHRYTECGFFCVLGYKGNRRVVHAHFNSEEEYNRLKNPRKDYRQHPRKVGRRFA